MAPNLVWTLEGERELRELPTPLDLETLRPGAGSGDWEVEIGFGKGRYLLARAARDPERRFLGIEVASPYYRLARDRAARRGLANLVLIRGDALFLLSALLRAGWAGAVHVYFPDPWPKDRHHKRRLLDAESVDLVLGLLRPGGRLCFATDFLDYGALVRDILVGHPAVEVVEHQGPWSDGARTNYEAKFVAEGRPILRLTATRRPRFGGPLLHPSGRAGIVAAPRTAPESRA